MSRPVSLVATTSVRLVLRERVVALLAALFVVLVMISAWLGWSATSTVNGIYVRAAAFLAAAGQPVPPNPVLDISPLSLMRNMVVYVALIGALAAIVVGNRLMTLDRAGGVVPLLASRPMTRRQLAIAKIAALAVVIAGLTGVAALVSIAAFAVLPATSLDLAGWLRLFGFFGISALYMMLFGLLALGCAALARSESVALLIPVTIWLTLTFILPSLTANIHPTAAINPIAALAPAPDSTFFHWTGALLGPLSLGESYKVASAGLLNFLPATHVAPVIPPVAGLLAAGVIAVFGAVAALVRMDRTKGEFDV